jgi:hypothetical protein
MHALKGADMTPITCGVAALLCLLAATTCRAEDVGAVAQPLADADTKALVDTARLQAYWQADLTLDQSLCLQGQLGPQGMRALPDGPQEAGKASLSDHHAERLRHAWERCMRQPDGAPGVRLVLEARTRYQEAVLRLQLPAQQLKLCRQEPPEKGGPQACLQRVLGRAPNESERQWLLALGGSTRP